MISTTLTRTVIKNSTTQRDVTGEATGAPK